MGILAGSNDCGHGGFCSCAGSRSGKLSVDLAVAWLLRVQTMASCSFPQTAPNVGLKIELDTEGFSNKKVGL